MAEEGGCQSPSFLRSPLSENLGGQGLSIADCISHNMRFIRKAWGLNQTQMGKYLGMCRQNIYAWENGSYTVDHARQSKISQRLGVPWTRLSTERMYEAPLRPKILESVSVELHPPKLGLAEVRIYKSGARYATNQSADATDIGSQLQKALEAGKSVWVIIR